MIAKGPYTPRRRCLLTRTLQMARPPGTPDGCPKAAAQFLAAVAVGVPLGRWVGGGFAGWYDRRHSKP